MIGTGILSIFPNLNSSAFGTVYLIAILFLAIGTIVLVAFHPLKRGLHDLLVGSIVVRKDMYDSEKISSLMNPSKEKRAFTICGLLFIFSVGAIFFIYQKTSSMQPMLEDLMVQKHKIESNTPLTNVSINMKWQISSQSEGNSRKSVSLNIKAYLEKSLFDDKVARFADAQKAANIVVKSYSKIAECNYILIQIRTGYDIGIWSFYITQDYPFRADGKPIKTMDE